MDVFWLFLKLFNKLHVPPLFLLCSGNVHMSDEQAMYILHERNEDKGGSSISIGRSIKTTFDLQIIIPAYNVASYIDRCIQSVILQKTKYTYVLTIIDDGSTDETKTIVDKYIKVKNVIVVHQKNMGLSAARNIGLKNLVAKYVTFLDGDDALADGAIDAWLDNAYSNNADIVEGGYVYVYKGNQMSAYEHITSFIAGSRDLYGFSWGKVYRSDLFLNVRFPEHYWFEDTVGIYILYPLAKKKVTISNVVYMYTYNPKGITKKAVSSDKVLDSHYIMIRMLNDASNLGLIEENEMYYYEITLSQIVMNFKRSYMRGRSVRHAVSRSSVSIMNFYFKNCVSNNSTFKNVEKALKKDSYSKFLIAIFCF